MKNAIVGVMLFVATMFGQSVVEATPVEWRQEGTVNLYLQGEVQLVDPYWTDQYGITPGVTWSADIHYTTGSPNLCEGRLGGGLYVFPNPTLNTITVGGHAFVPNWGVFEVNTMYKNCNYSDVPGGDTLIRLFSSDPRFGLYAELFFQYEDQSSFDLPVASITRASLSMVYQWNSLWGPASAIEFRQPVSVPAPSGAVLLVLGVGLGLWRRR